MVRILFICHGNICRSPMAEFIMKDMARERGLEDMLYIGWFISFCGTLIYTLKEEERKK